MNRSSTFISAVIVAALSVAVAPTAAEAQRGGGRVGGGGRVASSFHGMSAQPRFSSPRGSFSSPSFRGSAGARSYSMPQARTRMSSPRGFAERGGGHGYFGRPGRIHSYFSREYVRPYGWRPYYPFHFIRPYYAFSPWLDVGFGIWCGYPVPYPWVYLGDYQPTVFGYDADDDQVVPATTSYSGVSFDIQPSNANLFVDGQYVGVAGSFGPSNEPLTLEPGTHRMAIQLEGYRPLEWDVTVEAGQVIPYRGVLDRQ